MTDDNIVEQRLSWSELNDEQKNAVLSLLMSKNPTQAAKKFKSITKRSLAYYWGKVYPTVKDIWKDLAVGAPEEALRILRNGSVAAAYELVDEISHKDVKIRNKASNDVLTYSMPKVPTTAIQVNNFMPILGGATHVIQGDNSDK